MATVEPWTKEASLTPRSPMPCSMAREGSAGVDGSLYTSSLPSLRTAKSVKVPPTSIPVMVSATEGLFPLGALQLLDVPFQRVAVESQFYGSVKVLLSFGVPA